MNADARIRFRQAPDGSARLVFGDAAGSGEAPGARIALNAGLGGLAMRTSAVRTLSRASVHATFPALHAASGAVRLAWDANVSRVQRHEQRHHWQQGERLQATSRAHWQSATPETMLLTSLAALWQEGQRAARGLRAHWQDNDRLPAAQRHHWQDADAIRAALRALWQSPHAVRAMQRHHWQEGAPLRAAQRHHWAENLRLRAAQRHWWNEGLPARAITGGHWHQQGARLHHAERHWWNEAKKPCGGVSGNPWDVQPERPICYDPDTLGRLVFWQPYEAPLARLVFVCEYSGSWRPPVPQPALVTVPALRSYIVVNEIAIIRARDGMPIVCDAFSMLLDAESWTWSWQGSIPLAELPKITPGKDGNEPYDPVGVLVTLNGCTFHLLAESWTRSREFARSRINVRGRGRNALLDAPYAYASVHENAQQQTAQQLMAQALLINGVSSGWELDFQLADWLVPAGAWNFTGTPIAAVLDVAQAAAAMVLPHRTERTLRILPHYAVAPWLWAAEAQPHFELPADVVQTEGVEWQTMPDYDRVFISGTTADGITAQVTRAGQPGDIVKPMVTHPLITAEAPARARGIAELAQAGKLATVTLNLPVLHETGVIEPGHMVRYRDALQEAPFIGAVRSVQVQWQRPVLRQTITLETHDYEGLEQAA